MLKYWGFSIDFYLHKKLAYHPLRAQELREVDTIQKDLLCWSFFRCQGDSQLCQKQITLCFLTLEVHF